MSRRLFLGLFPEPLDADAVMRVQDAVSWPAGAKRVRRENLHVTLQFLGEVDETRLDELLRSVELPAPQVEIVLTRFAVWHGGIAVLEPEAVPDPLAALHTRLGDALRAAGFATEARAYRPHVTLARHAQDAALAIAPQPLRWRAARYALAQSTGGRYVPLRHFPLIPA